MKELPKAYEPRQYEDIIYKRWEESGFFAPIDETKENKASTFSMVLPPPNVTGTLHMGHAVMLAVQDVMTRYHRMKGDRTLWIPGTDHAAIATESKVEKLLIEEGIHNPKQTLGREPFLDRVAQFAQESHDTIVNQSKKMGSSLDWSREAFTLDATREKAVRSVFKMMYDDGLIYRGFRTVNWSVQGQSTCSDDEVEHITRQSKLYTFKYSEDCPIDIATTRPETKIGDTAIAVHPEGKWKEFIGQTFTVENFANSGNTLTLKVFGDENIDDNFGTGALGVTTAHSHIDFEMYTRQKALGNDIGMFQVIGEDGNMTAEAGTYIGKTVDEARASVVAQLRADGLLIHEEDIEQNIGISDRFKDIIEVLPKMQWFIDVNKEFAFKGDVLGPYKKGDMVTLKSLMQESVRGGHINIIPERFEKTYFHWIDNLRDWCISRQIWYGHQVPVWYPVHHQENSYGFFHFQREVFKLNPSEVKHFNVGLSWYPSTEYVEHMSFADASLLIKDGKITLADITKVARVNVGMCTVWQSSSELSDCVQDPDTLDTWFSSGLWTFSTLAHTPEDIRIEDGKLIIDTDDFNKFHPTSVLETGYDILPFWVARMILMTTYAVGDIPFETVYLHGLVRDEQGRKMSKSLGNILDPLDMTAKYGTDATRLSLLIGATPGNDTKLSEDKVAGFRNFTNKLWNIARFMRMQMNDVERVISTLAQRPVGDTLADRWILVRLDQVIVEVTKDIEEYRFSMAGEKLREFTWNDLADWYLEIAKVEGNKSEVLQYILNTILKLWHPYMPYVTELIWTEVYGKDAMLMVEAWPIATSLQGDEADAAISSFELLQSIITSIRALRAEKNIEPSKKIDAILVAKEQSVFEENAGVVKALARIEALTITAEKPVGEFVSVAQSGVEVLLDFSGAIDVNEERVRIKKELDHVGPYLKQLEVKLAGPFAQNAPESVVAVERQKLVEAQEKHTTLEQQLTQLG
jgi:valyl-tRNA synthetase